jgi:hypothetical protein
MLFVIYSKIGVQAQEPALIVSAPIMTHVDLCRFPQLVQYVPKYSWPLKLEQRDSCLYESEVRSEYSMD